MGRWRVAAAFAVAAVLSVENPAAPRADTEDDTWPVISAERLGEADAPEPAPEADDHYLSPAERDALAAQGYELEIDDRIVTQTRIQPARSEQDDKPKGRFGRTMETMGRGMVAVASVVLPIAAAVAPFLLF
jgi:hypothetical protein